MTIHRGGEVALEYDLHEGTGDPTVLIHGSLVDRRTWGAVAGALAHSLPVLAYDRRGYGGSTGPARTDPVRDDARDLAGLLESTEFYPAHLVAHSYGGAVALRLAEERPELVRSVVLHEPPMIRLAAEDPDLSAEARRWAAGGEQIRALLRAGMAESAAREVVNAFSTKGGAWDRLRPEARQAAVAYMGLWSDEFRDLERIERQELASSDLWIPVLVTSGELSPPLVRRIASLLALSLRNATERTIPGTGHAPHLTAPDRYVAIVLAFLLERNVPPT